MKNHTMNGFADKVRTIAFAIFLGCGSATTFAANGLVFYDPLEDFTPPSGLEGRKIASKSIEFVEGKKGKCAHFINKKLGGISYPVGLMPLDEGTIEFWLSFDDPPNTFVQRKDIFGYHPTVAWFKNLFTLFIGGQEDWGQALDFLVGDQNSKDGATSFSVVTQATQKWAAHEWHHVAVTWKVNVANSSAMLYLDHALAAKKTDFSCIQDMNARKTAEEDPIYGLFWLSPSWSGNQDGFSIDELKVYSVQRDYTSLGE